MSHFATLLRRDSIDGRARGRLESRTSTLSTRLHLLRPREASLAFTLQKTVSYRLKYPKSIFFAYIIYCILGYIASFFRFISNFFNRIET